MTEINKHGYMKTHLLIYVPNILYGLVFISSLRKDARHRGVTHT